MCCLDDMVLFGVDEFLLLMGKSTPKDEDTPGRRFGADHGDDGVCKALPADLRM